MRIEMKSPLIGLRAGLTLMELLVVMMIITLLAGSAVVAGDQY